MRKISKTAARANERHNDKLWQKGTSAWERNDQEGDVVKTPEAFIITGWSGY
jgi:hypothetical protein